MSSTRTANVLERRIANPRFLCLYAPLQYTPEEVIRPDSSMGLPYLHGALAPGYPFGELQRRGHINGRAHQPGADADFSRAIRAGVPGIPAREWR